MGAIVRVINLSCREFEDGVTILQGTPGTIRERETSHIGRVGVVWDVALSAFGNVLFDCYEEHCPVGLIQYAAIQMTIPPMR